MIESPVIMNRTVGLGEGIVQSLGAMKDPSCNPKDTETSDMERVKAVLPVPSIN